MNIQVDFWHVAGLMLGFIGVLATFGRIQLAKIDKHLDRFDKRLELLEKDLSDHKINLPMQYQRREDAIRFETTLNAKLDAIYGRVDRLNHTSGS